ncbi:ABC transporter permease [Streptomyces argenteolus]|uniref:ABC transporter permease n=1 Tax=Streptomyces argenteolus TaxID=67274 RepID=A0ABW6XGT5_9ACTN
MLRLALATLRARKGPFAATFLALLMGAAVISACGVLLESGLRSTLPPERYENAPLIVAGRQSAELDVKSADGSTYRSSQPLPERLVLPADLADDLAAIDGVASVVSDRGAAVRLLAADRAVTGHNGTSPQLHNWDSRPLGGFRLTAGHQPRGAHEVVLDSDLAARSGLRIGSSVRLMTTSTPVTFEVAGLVALDGGRAPRQSVLFAADTVLDRLAPDTADGVYAFGVLTAPGTAPSEVASDVEHTLKGQRSVAVYTGGDRGKAEFTDVAVGAANVIDLATASAGTSCSWPCSCCAPQPPSPCATAVENWRCCGPSAPPRASCTT